MAARSLPVTYIYRFAFYSDEAIFQILRTGSNSRNRNIGGGPDEYSAGSSITSSLSEILWRRARVAGAITPFEQKAFGIADDMYFCKPLSQHLIPLCQNNNGSFYSTAKCDTILFVINSYAGGLLMAYMIFISLCKSGSIDGPSLQVGHCFLMESTEFLCILGLMTTHVYRIKW